MTGVRQKSNLGHKIHCGSLKEIMHCAVCLGKRRIYGRSTGEAQFVRRNA